MAEAEVECVLNVSEGRDSSTIEQIGREIRRTSGCLLLDVSTDGDHNRSVLTFVGTRDTISDAAFDAVARAVELIDLRGHRGVHPRIGAADVVPFVPLSGEATFDECIRIARQLGRRVSAELAVPVYLYGRAATQTGRADLATIRRGGFEGLLTEIESDPGRRPDFGTARLHPTAGATAIGVRDFLIAYNVYLKSPEVEIARKIARRIREKDGGLPSVLALGFYIQGRRQSQVSVNLKDYRKTSLLRLFEAILQEAERLGTEVAEGEFIGLVPAAAAPSGSTELLQLMGFDPSVILETRISSAMSGGSPQGR